MFEVLHEHAKKFYTLIALSAAVTTVAIRIALYERTIDESVARIERIEKRIDDKYGTDIGKLQEAVAFLESQSASKSQMDRHQNRQIERIEGVIFLPRKTRFNL